MIQSLLLRVWEEAKEKGITKNDPGLDKALVVGLQEHVTKLGDHQEKIEIELATEEAEQMKKITSEDIHEGFDSKVRRIPLPVQSADGFFHPVRTPKARTTSSHRASEEKG